MEWHSYPGYHGNEGNVDKSGLQLFEWDGVNSSVRYVPPSA